MNDSGLTRRSSLPDHAADRALADRALELEQLALVSRCSDAPDRISASSSAIVVSCPSSASENAGYRSSCECSSNSAPRSASRSNDAGARPAISCSAASPRRYTRRGQQRRKIDDPGEHRRRQRRPDPQRPRRVDEPAQRLTDDARRRHRGRERRRHPARIAGRGRAATPVTLDHGHRHATRRERLGDAQTDGAAADDDRRRGQRANPVGNGSVGSSRYWPMPVIHARPLISGTTAGRSRDRHLVDEPADEPASDHRVVRELLAEFERRRAHAAAPSVPTCQSRTATGQAIRGGSRSRCARRPRSLRRRRRRRACSR